MKYKKLALTIAAGALSATMMAQSAPKLNANNIDEVLKAMTLEEKAQLLVGGGNDGFVGSGAMLGHQKKYVAGAAGTTVEIPRLGIPATVQADGPAGVHIDTHRDGDSRTYYATGFPIGTCLASTWNTDLMRNVGVAIGNETLEYGCDVVLGPGMNLHRNPLCGRNFEYYSEDPVMTGLMGTAFVQGVQSQGVGVSAKHFAVNSQETQRTHIDERVSQRALRELYLKGFEMMVRKSNPWTIMSAYNKVNGVYAQGNKDLLTNILRNDWGFKGIVETDWIGIREDLPVYQEVAAGNDLMMPGYPAQVKAIVEAVNKGKLDIADVDRNVRRMLEYIVKTPRFKGYKYSGEPDLKAHAAITRQSSTEGMVLLKNDATLPIKDLKTVALFGVNSYDFLSGGLGSGAVNVGYSVDMVTGLKNIGVSTTPQLTEIYQNYVKYAKAKLKADKNPMMWFLDQGQPKLDEIEITERCVAHEEPLADAAVITIGRQAGEGMDRENIIGEFELTQDERDMIFRVSDIFHAKGKKVIVVINSGSVMETVSWRDRVDAILVAWQPGIEGGNSVADILSGKVNPSGKLTMTWPVSVYDHPSTANYAKKYDMYTYTNMSDGSKPGIDFNNHEEDIYVGYRYFDTFKKNVAYPFGYGLSYTTFEFGKPSVKANGNNIEVSVCVKNTGKVAGKQVYVTAPKGAYEKPAKELKTFGKTKELQPGESQTLKMTLEKRDLASFDEANSQWKVDAGSYLFQIGSDVETIKGTATLKVAEYTEKVSSACPVNVQMNYLKQK